MASEKLNLKLLVDKSSQKVIFAEAGKDFVDLLFSFLAMPVGCAIRLLSEQRLDGCIAKLFESVENLSDTYIRSGLNKSSLLNLVTPFLPPTSQTTPLLLQMDGKTTASNRYYRCDYCINHIMYSSCSVQQQHVTDTRGTICPSCNREMTNEVENVWVKGAGPSGEGGYVKGVVTYMVTDDLVVTPMSTISSIALLNKLNVKEVGALEEKVVEVGMEEALALLKASLQSEKALTGVFLGKVSKMESDLANINVS